MSPWVELQAKFDLFQLGIALPEVDMEHPEPYLPVPGLMVANSLPLLYLFEPDSGNAVHDGTDG